MFDYIKMILPFNFKNAKSHNLDARVAFLKNCTHNVLRKRLIKHLSE